MNGKLLDSQNESNVVSSTLSIHFAYTDLHVVQASPSLAFIAIVQPARHFINFSVNLQMLFVESRGNHSIWRSLVVTEL